MRKTWQPSLSELRDCIERCRSALLTGDLALFNDARYHYWQLRGREWNGIMGRHEMDDTMRRLQAQAELLRISG